MLVVILHGTPFGAPKVESKNVTYEVDSRLSGNDNADFSYTPLDVIFRLYSKIRTPNFSNS